MRSLKLKRKRKRREKKKRTVITRGVERKGKKEVGRGREER